MDDYKTLIEDAGRQVVMLYEDRDGDLIVADLLARLSRAVGALSAIEQRLTDHIVQLAEERDALQQQLNTDNFESARSRIAALEAVIRSVDDWFNDLGDTRCPDGERLARLLDLAPSVVLDGMIREAQETAVREHAQTLAATMRAEFEKTIVDIQAENILLKRSTWEAQAKAVESARDAIMPPVNWNLRPDGTEMPGTRHIDEALRDIHVHLSEISAAYRKGGEVARD